MIEKQSAKVWVTAQFEGYHQFPLAPNDVSFLRNLHRHVFKIRIDVQVNPQIDRSIEFFQLKRKVEGTFDFVKQGMVENPNTSCERIAEIIAERMEEFLKGFNFSVEVSEDGENGVTVSFIRPSITGVLFGEGSALQKAFGGI